MASHWTYEKIEKEDEPLRQGDILWPRPELRRLFEEIHPHFCDSKYIAFVITTQSCDLVRRDGKPCKADYINLAVVRDLESCLSQFLDNVCQKVSPSVYLKGSKVEAYQLLTRILNQNEQMLGLFYLHPDADTVGISDYAVVLLRVAVAVHAKEHYELLQKVRTGRLAGQFRNKLGWLVGNLYSRVGTPDWSEQKDGDKQMEKLISYLIDSDLYIWVSKSLVNAAKKAGVCIDEIPSGRLMVELKKYQPAPFKEQIAEAAKQEVNKVISKLPDQILEEIDSKLPFEDETTEKVKAELNKILTTRFNQIPQKIRNRLINNTIFSRAVSREELE